MTPNLKIHEYSSGMWNHKILKSQFDDSFSIKRKYRCLNYLHWTIINHEASIQKWSKKWRVKRRSWMALKMQMNHSHAFQKGQKCRLYKKCDHFLGSKVEFICQTNPSPPSRARILMSSLFFVGIEFKVFSKINIAGLSIIH